MSFVIEEVLMMRKIFLSADGVVNESASIQKFGGDTMTLLIISLIKQEFNNCG